MKRLFQLLILLLFTGIYAQNDTIDRIEQTTVQTVEKDDKGDGLNSRVKVKTIKEQSIMTNPMQSGELNQDRYLPGVKVTKTISIDSDRDSFYDEKVELTYYEFKGKKYFFSVNDKGFDILSDPENSSILATAIISSTPNLYLMEIDGLTGFGYFDEQGNLIVDYLDRDDFKVINMKFNKLSF